MKCLLTLFMFLTPVLAHAEAGVLGVLDYPAIGISSPVYQAKIEKRNIRKLPNQWLEDALQKTMRKGIAAYPNQRVLAAHSSSPTGRPFRTDSLFAPLLDAEIGQELSFRGKSYRVYQTEIVNPASIYVLKVPKDELRLFTCFPIGKSTERFVVYAKIAGSLSRQSALIKHDERMQFPSPLP